MVEEYHSYYVSFWIIPPESLVWGESVIVILYAGFYRIIQSSPVSTGKKR